MNIIINYDFFNAVKDENEGFTPFKVIRNCKTRWVKFNLPLLTAAELLTFRENFLKYMPEAIMIQFFLVLGANIAGYLTLGDIYKDNADTRLKTLVLQLKNMNIDTSFDLIKESSCESKIYNLKFNKKKIPQLVECKYILVPSYNYQGDVVETSIMQEHVVGSSLYTLSHGSPKKELKLVYSKA